MSRSAEIRRPVLAGHQPVDALWWPAGWLSEAARREAILGRWCEGATLYRFDDGDLLCWPSSRWMDCGELGAWPLRRAEGVLCSAAVGRDEWTRRGDRAGVDAWLGEGGRLRPLRFAEARRVDPSEWIAAETLLVEPFDLSHPVPEAMLVVAPRDAREVLGPDVPRETAAGTHQMLEALRRAGQRSQVRADSAARNGRTPSPSQGGDAAGRGFRWDLLFRALVVLSMLRFLALMVEHGKDGTPGFAGVVIVLIVFALVLELVLALRARARKRGGVDVSHPGQGTVAVDPVRGNTPDAHVAGATDGIAAGLMSGVAVAIARVVDGTARAVGRVVGRPGVQGVGSTGQVERQGRGTTYAEGPGERQGDPKVKGRGTAVGNALRARLERAGIRPQAWRQWAARLSMTTGLMSMIGMRNAAYMRRVMRMFDEGDFKDALRHAPPVSGGMSDASTGPAFFLGPRDDLSLHTRRVGGGPSFGASDGLMGHLRALYRNTAAKLEAQGRIDEAAYVLAVLLDDRKGALDLMERHGRLDKAADLALSWDMPAAVIVRYYALAGDWRQAVRVARRDRAFAEAVVELEKRWPDAARRLRVEWAESLAERGEPRAALRTIWPIPEERGRAAEWLTTVEAAGGAEAARALVWRAQGWPDSMALHHDELDRLLSTPDLAVERAAMVDELLSLDGSTSPMVKHLALLLAGPVLEDQARLPHPLLPLDALMRLTKASGDAALAADLPEWKKSAVDRPPQALAERAEPFDAATPSAGGMVVHDAMALPDGEWLLALGESGVVRLDARGRRRAHLPVPAERIVAAFDGGSALLLAPREGDQWRISRLVIPEERVTDLGTHRLTAFADQFDGESWTTSDGPRVRVLDVLAPMLGEVLWQVADLPGTPVSISAEPTLENWWLVGKGSEAGKAEEVWIYTLPSRRLIRREPLEDTLMPGSSTVLRMPQVDGGPIDLMGFVDENGMHCLKPHDPLHRVKRFPPLLVDHRQVLAVGGRWIAMWAVDGQERRVELLSLDTGHLLARWSWPSKGAPRARFRHGRWFVFDDEGRAAALDIASGRQWSLSASGHA